MTLEFDAGRWVGAGVAWALSAWIFNNASLSAKSCSGSHCKSVVYVHSGTEHGRPGILDVVVGDVVAAVDGHASNHSVLKSSVVINKLAKLFLVHRIYLRMTTI